MKRNIFYSWGILSLILMFLAITNPAEMQDKKTQIQDINWINLIPESLDDFFSPKAEQPIYLSKMIEMPNKLQRLSGV